MELASWKCEAGDKIKFAMNKRSFQEGNLMHGKIVKRMGKLVLVESETLPRPVKIHVSCLRIVNPILTEGRMKKALAGAFKLKQGTTSTRQRSKKTITNSVGEMSFTYKKG
jgi:hypothetical protein